MADFPPIPPIPTVLTELHNLERDFERSGRIGDGRSYPSTVDGRVALALDLGDTALLSEDGARQFGAVVLGALILARRDSALSLDEMLKDVRATTVAESTSHADGLARIQASVDRVRAVHGGQVRDADLVRTLQEAANAVAAGIGLGSP